ncbi:MAG: DegV family protein [Christensenellaceae bacterium]|jgi:DegV family protein with EDD domain
MANEYAILTDVTVDLPAELLKTLGIPALPMPFTIDGDNYIHYADFRDISPGDFYKKLREGATAATSQVTYASYMEYFTPVLEAGKDILFIAFSSALSGNYQGSVVAAKELMEKYPARKIITVDTLAASSGEGMLVYYAARKKEEGYSLEALATWLEENKLSMCHWFTVDDLGFLRRGGRISATSATIGSMLRIKPVMHVDNAGRLIPMQKVRGRKKALRRLCEFAAQTGVNIKEQTIFICQADARDEAEFLANMIKEATDVSEIIITDIGPIIGAHAGPGTISVFFFGKAR